MTLRQDAMALSRVLNEIAASASEEPENRG
jgi:hypothetical protein